MFLYFLFILSSYSLYDTCHEAREITEKDLDSNFIGSFTGDISENSPFCYVCTSRISCPTELPRSQFYSFQLQKTRQIEISTCNSETNFNTRILVLEHCDEGRAHTCITSNDDDTELSDCNGGKSEVIFTAEAGKKYYIAISGSSPDDVGTFKFTIKEFENFYKKTCEEAYEVKEIPTTLRGTITEDMKITIPGIQNTRGTWFKYYNELNQSVFIDTCGGFTTSMDLEIYVFEGDDEKCGNPVKVGYDDDSCGNLNPRIFMDFKQEQWYYIVLNMKTSVPGQVGQYRLNLRTSAAENAECKGAIGINSLPYKVTVPMKHFPTEKHYCRYEDKETEYVGMYFSIVGDGSKYIIDTCESNPNGFNSGYITGIELFPYCGSGSVVATCSNFSYGTCGDDAYMEVEIPKDQTIFIRATCTSPDCIITFSVDKADSATNNKCISPKIITFFKDGDYYEQTDIDVNTFTPSVSGCDGKFDETKGAWYAFVSATDITQNIDVIVTPKIQSDYRPVIELHHDCQMEDCIDTSSNNLFTFQFAHSINHNYRLLYATTIARKSGIEGYGRFDFWATLKNDYEGDTYANPISITEFPYTQIGYINTKAPFVSQCYKENHNKEVEVNGVWFKFHTQLNKSLVINTCGPETHIDTAIEVLIPGASFNERRCYVSNKDDNSPLCGKQAKVTVLPFETSQQLVTAIISDPGNETNPQEETNYGTYRASFYYDEEPINGKCTDYIEIESFPYNHFSYITKSTPSIVSFNGTETTVIGTWYRIIAPGKGELYILADDLSEVDTIIATFNTSTCTVFEGINRPQDCSGIYTYETHPYGHRGSHITLNLEAGEEIMLLVGGVSGADGIVHFKLTYLYQEEPLFVKSGFYLTKLTWVIFGYVIISIALITGIIIGVLYWFNNRHKITYGKL